MSYSSSGRQRRPAREGVPLPQGCENVAVSSRNKSCNPKMRKRKKMMPMKAPVMMTAGLMPLLTFWLVSLIFHQQTMAVICCITMQVKPYKELQKGQLWVSIAGEINHQHFERPAATCRVGGSSLGWMRSCHCWTLPVLTHLPIKSLEWECVASEHNENFPDKDQTGTSIRRKLAQLCTWSVNTNWWPNMSCWSPIC